MFADFVFHFVWGWMCILVYKHTVKEENEKDKAKKFDLNNLDLQKRKWKNNFVAMYNRERVENVKMKGRVEKVE